MEPLTLQQALQLHQQGHLDAAEQGYQAILQAQPTHADALHLLGVIAYQRKQYTIALPLIQQALSIQPNLADAWANLGLVQQALRDNASALTCHNQAIALKPQQADYWYNRGNSWQALRDYAQAAQDYTQALCYAPQHLAALNNLGKAQLQLQQLDEALASFTRALALQPQQADLLVNRGLVLHELQRFAEALQCYNQALQIQPNHGLAQLNRGLLHLLQGDFSSGWRAYEWRQIRTQARFSEPLWLGETALQGKRILLHAEQGLGDTLQFCRYAQVLAATGATVLLEAQPELQKLLSTLSGVTESISHGAPLPQFDYHCPLLSLPLACQTTLDNIPVANGYLQADPHPMHVWRTALQQRSAPFRESAAPVHIGLCWSGNAANTRNHKRSLSLEKLLSTLPFHLGTRPVHYACLQKDLTVAEQQLIQQHPALWHATGDFVEIAALIRTLDGVISVDTAMAHLTGALGQRLWLLLAWVPDWRWLLNRTDSPWYRTATLVRQTELNQWEGALQSLTQSLTETFIQSIH